ncbi:MAG: hypothetical protein ACWGSD_11090 [Thermodesulfobacteriota bacterium]
MSPKCGNCDLLKYKLHQLEARMYGLKAVAAKALGEGDPDFHFAALVAIMEILCEPEGKERGDE